MTSPVHPTIVLHCQYTLMPVLSRYQLSQLDGRWQAGQQRRLGGAYSTPGELRAARWSTPGIFIQQGLSVASYRGRLYQNDSLIGVVSGQCHSLP